MKLIIQVPCYNEARSLANTLACIPREVPGFSVVELLVIDDGSEDNSASIAKSAGAHYIVRHIQNRGLARAFETGLLTALEAGADVIVNTDADNQYCAADIPLLTAPILAGCAELVIGARPINSIGHFSPLKKLLQHLGSATVRVVSNTSVADATSGFRAISRSAAQRLHVFSDYTYTLETIIQAGQNHIAIASVPVRVNTPERESKLVRNMFDYTCRSIGTIVRIFVIYRPLWFFSWLSMLVATPGILIGIRFLIRYIQGHGQGMVQSLILASILIAFSFLLFIAGLLGDLIGSNRQLMEQAIIALREIRDRLPKRGLSE